MLFICPVRGGPSGRFTPSDATLAWHPSCPPREDRAKPGHPVCGKNSFRGPRATGLALLLLALPLLAAPKLKAPKTQPISTSAPFRTISWQPTKPQLGSLWDPAIAFRLSEEAQPTLRLVPAALPAALPLERPLLLGARPAASCRF